MPPAGSGLVGPVPPSTRSADRLTVVAALAALFVVTGSISAAVTLAVSVIAPATSAWTRIVTVAVAPLLSAPTLQVTTVAAIVHGPWLGISPVRPTPAGSVLLRTTPLAAEGPPLVTVSVYWIVE